MGILILVLVLVAAVGYWIYEKYTDNQLNKRMRLRAKHQDIDFHLKRLSENIKTVKRCQHALVNVVTSAESRLPIAKSEFDNRAYGPFWDEMESIVKNLASFSNLLDTIKQTVESYQWQRESAEKSLKELLELEPEFRFSGYPRIENFLVDIPAVKHIHENVQQLMRQGRSDFEFAQIFEQRKTNNLLDSGFKSLNEAITKMDSRINQGLLGLVEAVHGNAVLTEASIDKVQEQLVEVNSRFEEYNQQIESGIKVTVQKK